MCGITGFWQFGGSSKEVLGERVQRMMRTLRHRGPDDEGAWLEPAAGLALGFRRLAILDLSPSGHQPMMSPDRRWIIVFNGEIYNYRDLRVELEKAGCRFQGTSDTEVILGGCALWGPEATIPRLWGMFAIAIWDQQERKLVLARDRLGKKPLYYTQTPHCLAFGSELKALWAHAETSFEVDTEALGLYLRYGYVPAPSSILQGVKKLSPGSIAIITGAEPLQLHSYWSARQVVLATASQPQGWAEAEAVEQLDYLLRDAVARRMIADVPLGALLSGGVDSSVVVALMQAQSQHPVKTFTIGFPVAQYNEADWAKSVARHLGTEHTELYATPADALDVIRQLPELYDEPLGDSSQIPTYLVCQLVRRYVTVGLSGDGGDELFGGYRRYRQAAVAWDRFQKIPIAVRQAVAAALRIWPAERWSDWLTTPTEWMWYHRFMSLWREPQKLQCLTDHGPDTAAAFLADPEMTAARPDFIEQMMYLDLVTYLPEDILVKLDRASMGVSLEARCPLLDHRVVEWAWSIPLALKCKGGQGKWLLRQVLLRYVPQTLIDRPKMGFGVPLDTWLRGPLRDWAEALLDERRLRQEGYLAPELIRQAWATHLAGRRDEQHRLWIVLMFQAWREKWLTR